MEPTLQVDDRVLVLKNTFIETDISSGDIVVFYSPQTQFKEDYFEEFVESVQIWKLRNDDTYLNTALIKRVVGNSGDEVTVKESGEVFVNGNRFTVLNINEGRNFKEQTYIVPANEIFESELFSRVWVIIILLSPSIVLTQAGKIISKVNSDGGRLSGIIASR